MILSHQEIIGLNDFVIEKKLAFNIDSGHLSCHLLSIKKKHLDIIMHENRYLNLKKVYHDHSDIKKKLLLDRLYIVRNNMLEKFEKLEEKLMKEKKKFNEFVKVPPLIFSLNEIKNNNLNDNPKLKKSLTERETLSHNDYKENIKDFKFQKKLNETVNQDTSVILMQI